PRRRSGVACLRGRTAAIARAGAIARTGGTSGRARRRCLARGVTHVALGILGTAVHSILGFVVEIAAAIGQFGRHFLAALRPLTGTFSSLAVTFRRLVLEIAGLFGELVAKLRPGFGCEQHPEPRAQHGPGEKPHHEAAAATSLILETIVSVCHLPPPVHA